MEGGGYTADLERGAHCSAAEVDFMSPALSSSSMLVKHLEAESLDSGG